MIKIEHLRKIYGEIAAVDDASFTAHAGEIFGLLGPNGAGKTTTIGCISGLLAPTAGRILVDGHDVVRERIAARRSIGVVPQELAMYDDLTAIENLEYWGGAQGLRGQELKQRIAGVLELTGLQDRARETVKRYSGGMKRRLASSPMPRSAWCWARRSPAWQWCCADRLCNDRRPFPVQGGLGARRGCGTGNSASLRHSRCVGRYAAGQCREE
jgi:ABC-type transport system involved in cytochrome c biogenesis ATPase subunit